MCSRILKKTFAHDVIAPLVAFTCNIPPLNGAVSCAVAVSVIRLEPPAFNITVSGDRLSETPCGPITSATDIDTVPAKLLTLARVRLRLADCPG